MLTRHQKTFSGSTNPSTHENSQTVSHEGSRAVSRAPSPVTIESNVPSAIESRLPSAQVTPRTYTAPGTTNISADSDVNTSEAGIIGMVSAGSSQDVPRTPPPPPMPITIVLPLDQMYANAINTLADISETAGQTTVRPTPPPPASALPFSGSDRIQRCRRRSTETETDEQDTPSPR